MIASRGKGGSYLLMPDGPLPSGVKLLFAVARGETQPEPIPGRPCIMSAHYRHSDGSESAFVTRFASFGRGPFVRFARDQFRDLAGIVDGDAAT